MKAMQCVGIINQCTRCYSLRDPLDKGECPTCRALLNEKQVTVRTLSIQEMQDDGKIPDLFVMTGPAAMGQA